MMGSTLCTSDRTINVSGMHAGTEYGQPPGRRLTAKDEAASSKPLLCPRHMMQSCPRYLHASVMTSCSKNSKSHQAVAAPGKSRHILGAVLSGGLAAVQFAQTTSADTSTVEATGRHTIEGSLECSAGHGGVVPDRLWLTQGQSDTAVLPCTTILAATRQQGTSKAACWVVNTAKHLQVSSSLAI